MCCVCVRVEDLDNRWLIRLSSDRAAAHLTVTSLGSGDHVTADERGVAAAHLVTEGIDLYNRHIVVRHYDDVLGPSHITPFTSRDRPHADHVTCRCPPVDDVLAEEYAEYLDYRQYDDACYLAL